MGEKEDKDLLVKTKKKKSTESSGLDKKKKKKSRRTKDKEKEIIVLDTEDEGKKNKSKRRRKREKDKTGESKDNESKKKRKRKKKSREKSKNEPVESNLVDNVDSSPIYLPESTDEPLDLRECIICNSWLPVSNMYFLDMCSHRFCNQCWKKQCIKSISEDIEPNCITCNGIITQNDLIFALSIGEYQDWQCKSKENLLGVYQNGDKMNCSICNSGNITVKPNIKLLPQLENEDGRRILCSIPAGDFQMLEQLQSVEEKLVKNCNNNDCKLPICVVCGKVSGMENGHTPYSCTRIMSLVINEILDNLENICYPNSSKSNSSSNRSSKYKKSSSKGGTGFAGTAKDSYHQVEEAKKKEGKENTVISQLLKILSNLLPNAVSYQPHTSLFPIIKDSCLLKLLAGYFRNNWLMDTNAQESDLYFSVLSVIRALSSDPIMFGIIMLPFDESNPSDCIRYQMEGLNKQTEFFMKKVESFESQEREDVTHVLGLSLDIQNVYAQIVDFSSIWCTGKISKYLMPLKKEEKQSSSKQKSKLKLLKKKSTKQKVSVEDAHEKQYVNAMKPLQFEFLNPFPTTKQNVKYLANLASAKQNSVTSPGVIVRISQELSSLATSLPLSINSGVFMRVNEEKVNEIRFIIIGPAGTPYENGCFEFEMIIGHDYPHNPPNVQIMTTGSGSVRFNPNLYNNGKVCLSLLGTWSGPGWDPKVSTLLQVLVSIQSLIMVPDPYFNEPGYESSRVYSFS